jgi:lon-related putative ATP-dependent protease
MMVKEISYTKARLVNPKEVVSCGSTIDLEPLVEIIGQKRAVEALKFGLEIEEEGFNIYVAGMPGTGKKTAVMGFLEQRAKDMEVPSDWCYVFNFQDEEKPNALKLPAGMGAKFRDEMAKTVEEIKKALVSAFESDDYAKKRDETVEQFDEKKNELMNELNEKSKDAGFVIQRTQIGILLIPVIDGKPINEQQFSRLPQRKQEELQDRRKNLQEDLRSALHQYREIDREAEAALEDFNKEVASYAMEHLFQALKDEYGDVEEVKEFLDAVKNDILDNLDNILVSQRQQQQQTQLPFGLGGMIPDPTERYKVNLIVDNSDLKGAPVIMETNPSHNRLFGATEKEARFGALVTNYTMIRGGSAHKANGGYLVIPVDDLARNPGSYESLKRTIQQQKIEIEELAERLGYITTKGLRPEPIPFNAKVILVGESRIYYMLYQLDTDFKNIFKVKAEFDTTMDRDDDNVQEYARFMCTLVNKENLVHLDQSGIAAVVEYSSRLAADQKKLSTQFAEVSDIIREASFYASQDKSDVIEEKHVNKAIEAKIYRSNMIEEKLEEMIERGSILVDTSGEMVGQVNGLAVMGIGDYMFGKPSRITASVGAGADGIINIERQADMSGPTHTKGVDILTGFLTGRYAKKHPLSLTARLTFEQSYSGVDGDSASSTETYALLSALSEVPIKQNFAVTGSVNQKGEVQAIGGVNDKIEGFYELCKSRGLDGSHGVMIPESNVENLMLKNEVVDAIKDGKFHIYPIKTIDEGIEVLTGVKAGEFKEDGTYPEDTINYKVQKKLEKLASIAKEYKD